MDRTERKLIRFASSVKFSDLPPQAVHAAKARIIDSIGVALAARHAPTVEAVARLAPVVTNGPKARLFGTLRPTTPEHAALVNGAMVRYLDMSDAYLRASTAHPSDNIPALLALAEAGGQGGEQLLLAVAVCYEVHIRLCQLAPFFSHGWDQGVAAAPAAALGSARLLGLDPDAMRHAVAIAVTAGLATRQTRAGNLSMWKGLAGPAAARAGVDAARMASVGISGPEQSFDGQFGLWEQAVGRRFSVPLPTRFDRHTFAVQQSNIKLFPMRDAVQVPILAALALRERCEPRDIRHLRIDSYRHAFEVQSQDRGFWSPRTRESADHSLPLGVAAALLDGEVTPATFADSRHLDADVKKMMKRMTLEFDEAFDRVAPATRNCRLVATLVDGCRVHVTRKQTAADIVRGPGDDVIERKFLALTASSLPPRRQRALLNRLWCLEAQERIAPVITLTGCA